MFYARSPFYSHRTPPLTRSSYRDAILLVVGPGMQHRRRSEQCVTWDELFVKVLTLHYLPY